MEKVKMKFEKVIKFEIVQNLVFAERDRPNLVLRAEERPYPFSWLFDSERAAAWGTEKLNKTEAKHGRVNAVACIIE